MKIADEALSDYVTVQSSDGGAAVQVPITSAFRLEAFGKLTAYFIGLKKIKAKMPGDEDDEADEPGGTLVDFSRKLRALEGGNGV